MGFVDRFSRVIRANISYLVKGSEDPEQSMKQALSEMQADLLTLRQSVAQAIASQKRTERQLAQAQQQAQEWYNRAQLAIQKGDELLAKNALTRRQSYQQSAQALQKQVIPQQQVVDRLKANLHQLEHKLTEARTQKDLFIARARAASSSLKISQLHQSQTGSLQAFEQMADRVNELESEAELAAMLRHDSLEQTFTQLEQESTIEAQMIKLKSTVAEQDKLAN